MVNLTIGSGGDYPDVGSAILDLQAFGLLADDYTFTVLEDIANTTAVPEGDPSTNIIRPNGHYVKFDLKGYTVTTSVLIMLNRSQGLVGGRGIIEFGNGNIFSANGYGGLKKDYLLWCRGNFPPGDNDPTSLWLVHDLFLSGHTNTTNPGTLFRMGRGRTGAMWSRVWNIKVYLKSRTGTYSGAENAAFNFEHDVPGGSVQTFISQFAENISIYVDDGAGKGVEAIYTYHDTYNSYEIHLRNVVAFRKQVNAIKDFNAGTNSTVEYCASGDDSLDPAVFPSATYSNNLYSVVTAADFLSVDPTSPDYLKISPASLEFEAGTAVIGSWNTRDFFGNPRPDTNGKVSIGIHEPLGGIRTHIVTIVNGLVKNWQIKAGGTLPTPPKTHTVRMRKGLILSWDIQAGGTRPSPSKKHIVTIMKGLVKNWTVD